ncbi:MAG: hypothetical protein WC558_07060 [Patulibacter sp.]
MKLTTLITRAINNPESPYFGKLETSCHRCGKRKKGLKLVSWTSSGIGMGCHGEKLSLIFLCEKCMKEKPEAVTGYMRESDYFEKIHEARDFLRLHTGGE